MKTHILTFLALSMPIFSVAEKSVSFSFHETVPFGCELQWTAAVANGDAETKRFAHSFLVRALADDGLPVSILRMWQETNTVAAASSTNFTCRVPFTEYSSLIPRATIFECSSFVWDPDNEEEEDFRLMRTVVKTPDSLQILVTPDPLPTAGETIEVVVSWTNSTSDPILANLSLSVIDGFETEDGETMLSWGPQTVVAGSKLEARTNLVVRASPEPGFAAILVSDTYPTVEADWPVD